MKMITQWAAVITWAARNKFNAGFGMEYNIGKMVPGYFSILTDFISGMTKAGPIPMII